MRPYHLNIPTKLYYGRDIWRGALREIEQMLRGSVMIVTTGRSLARLGYLGDLKRAVTESPLVDTLTVFDKVSANPRLSEAEEGVALAKDAKADVIIGFGGGSAMDMAKAVALGARTDEAVGAFFYGKSAVGKDILPVIAVPTTAGTGSELSRAAILTDSTKKRKGGIRGDALYPRAAIVDPIFTESVPFHITMQTGFDVLAHAMESYVSKAASPYTRMQSEYAVRTVGEMLPRLAQDLQDIEAREKMSYASMIMGINLGNASTGLPHRLQYPLGALTDTSHGQGLAALYCAWLGYEYQYSRESVEEMTSILAGRSIRGKEACTGAMREFITRLGLPVALQEMGIGREQLDIMAEAVTGELANDPAAQEQDIVRKIYERAWRRT